MRSTCFCRSLQMLLGPLWVENFGRRAECPNNGKILLNYSEMLLHSSIEIIIWCPLILLLEGNQETPVPGIRTLNAGLLSCTVSPRSDGAIYHGRQNPRRRLFSKERGSTMSHDRLGYLDFGGKANKLNWEADEVLPYKPSLRRPLCR